MANANRLEPYPLRAFVRVIGSGFKRGRVVEIRGNLGPQGARVYRIMYRRKPAAYTEVLEEQIELLDAEPDRPAASTTTAPQDSPDAPTR